MQRMGMVIGVKTEAIAEYKRLHASGSAEVNALLARAGLPPRYPSAAPAHASPDAPSTSGETIA